MGRCDALTKCVAPEKLLLPPFLFLDGFLYEGQEQRVRVIWPGFEFGVELTAQHEGMILQLCYLYQPPVRAETAKCHARILEWLTVGVVELPTMTMTLLHFIYAISLMGFGAGNQHAGVQPQAHGAAHVGDVLLIGIRSMMG